MSTIPKVLRLAAPTYHPCFITPAQPEPLRPQIAHAAKYVQAALHVQYASPLCNPMFLRLDRHPSLFHRDACVVREGEDDQNDWHV